MADTQGSVTIRFDYRWVVAVLLVVIVVMIALWRPWEPRYDAQARTIEASGQATVKAVPDEYAFYPSYSFKNADKATALADATKKSEEVVAGLKKTGVTDTAIKASVNGYQDGMYTSGNGTNDYVYTLSLTVTITDKNLSQKAQDYLVSTSPEGGVSPQPTFSDATRKTLESTARDKASKDARSKADQLAKNLGGKVGDIKTITDGVGFGGVTPMYAMDTAAGKTMPSSLTLQPGENDLIYTVSVIYYLR